MMGAIKEKVLKIFHSMPNMSKMGFLTSFFKTSEEDFTDAELVNIDIVRSGEQVAPVLTDVGTGAVVVSDDIFTGKTVRPPIYSIARPANIWDLMNRQPGETEYEAIGNWFGRLVAVLKRAFELMFGMIKRSIELQASQVLQTGKLDITNADGKVAYTLDFQMKSTHKKTVSTKWDQKTATPLKDLEAMCDAIRDDGLVDASIAIFGKDAWNAFIANAEVQAAFSKEGIGLGNIAPQIMNKGGKFMGFVNLGAYRVDLFVYNGRYETFNGASKASFVDPKNVIVLADPEDLDFRLVYGGVPSLPMAEPFESALPSEVIYDGNVRFNNRVFKDEKANTYTAETTARPICIPTSIDRFGCLTVLA